MKQSSSNRSNFTIMRRMIGLAKPMAGFMCLAVLFGSIGHLCATFLPVYAVDVGVAVASHTGINLQFAAIILVTLAVLRGVFHYIEQTCNHYIAFMLLAEVRNKVFGALRKLCPAKLSGADKGDLISMLTSDIELLEVFYAHTISPICIAFITSIVMIIFMGMCHPAFGAVALMAYLVVGVVVPIFVSRSTGDAGLVTRTMAGSLSSHVLDSLRGLREVLQFDARKQRIDELNRQSYELLSAQYHLNNQTALCALVTSIFVISFSLIQLAVGVSLYNAGEISMESMLIAVVALFSSFGPTLALSALGTTLQGTLASGSRVLDVLDEVPVVHENETGIDAQFSGALANDVSFAYGDETVLSKVNAKIPEGKIVAVSGKSGSGKSTLCRLFMRFWDVSDGSIQIGESDVREIKTTSLRDCEALVEQDTYLFHDSIRDNLLIAAPNATQEQIEEACKAASIHDFIMSLPLGYDTPVGELGDTLSGGERQRMGLARAFLHDAPFLLLDEPTSNLDSLNEGSILKSLVSVKGKRTVMLISHRASTLAIADEVISMDAGRVS